MSGATAQASPAPARRGLLLACAVAGLLALAAASSGIPVPSADVGAAAVDEPQYLLTATSIWEDGDLDISDERAQGRAEPFHDGALPVQTAVLEGGARVSPHDPLLPLLLAPAVGLGGWVGAKVMLSVLAGLLAAATAWVIGTRWAVSARLAGAVAAVAGMSAPWAVYGQQVYPELPAALAVVVAVGAIVPPCAARPGAPAHGAVRAVVLVVAISALPWLAAKYTLVAAALAGLAWVRMRSVSPRAALAVAAALGVSGAVWLAAHRALYGGWTAYATGDHFQASGEFGAVGFSPDLLGRSTRIVGLLVDRDYGLVAWQPAWLLAIPALGLIWGARSAAAPAARWALTLPLLAGWFTAVFLALTMHGFWFPGRQVVVVLPLAAMLIAVALSRRDLPARGVALLIAGALATVGLAVQVWALLAGYAGSLTWVGAPQLAAPAPLALMRRILPDYRELTASDWALHAAWVVVALALLLGGWLLGRRSAPERAADRRQAPARPGPRSSLRQSADDPAGPAPHLPPPTLEESTR